VNATLRAGWSYAQRRHRAQDLALRWPFAAEVLNFYAALLEVQQAASELMRTEAPARDEIPAFAAQRVLPRVVEVSAAHGPPPLQQGVLERFDTVDLEALCRAWLDGTPLEGFDRFLARAATAPLLEALPAPALSDLGAADERHCPSCGGLPQLAYFGVSADDLVTPHRYLECSHCATSWAFARMTCAACGEIESDRLLVLSERGTLEAEMSGRTVKADLDVVPDQTARATTPPRFPQLRIDGCLTCSQYLLSVDCGRDPAAVPAVDEIGAIPLALYAQERGLNKLVTNQMGF
jgi:formate dehydrogenase maturation protein FdhE